MLMLERQISHKSASSRPVLAAGQNGTRGRRLRTVRRSDVFCSSSKDPDAAAYTAANRILIEADAIGAPRQPYTAVVTGCAPCMSGATQVNIDESKVITKFVAETLLPSIHVSLPILNPYPR